MDVAGARGAGCVFSRYLLTLIACGIALFIPGPWIASRVFHADFAASFLTFTALVNLHHFVLDGAIWKLRDSRIAARLLITGRSADSGRAGTRRNAMTGAARWVAGDSAGARVLGFATVGVLFLWAGVDQIHFYWANENGNAAALERAAQLNPNDSSTQMRLARAESIAGRAEEKLAALRTAANVSATNLSVQEAYGRGLIEAARDVASRFPHRAGPPTDHPAPVPSGTRAPPPPRSPTTPLRDAPGEELSAVSRARAESEARAGREAVDIRRNRE